MNPFQATAKASKGRQTDELEHRNTGVSQDPHTYTQHYIYTNTRAKWTSQDKRWDGWLVPLTPEALYRSAN